MVEGAVLSEGSAKRLALMLSLTASMMFLCKIVYVMYQYKIANTFTKFAQD